MGIFSQFHFCVPSVLSFIHSSVEGNEKNQEIETEGKGGEGEEISCASAGSEIEIRGRSQGIRTHWIWPIRWGQKADEKNKTDLVTCCWMSLWL